MEGLALRTKVGIWIFTIAAGAFFLIDTRGAYFHWRDAGWPDHSMFHAVTGLFYTQILCVLIIVTAWTLLKRGMAWGWWAIGFMGIGIHFGHVIGDAVTHQGLRGAQAAQGSGAIFYAGTLIGLTLYIIGLILTRPHVSGAAAAE